MVENFLFTLNICHFIKNAYFLKRLRIALTLGLRKIIMLVLSSRSKLQWIYVLTFVHLTFFFSLEELMSLICQAAIFFYISTKKKWSFLLYFKPKKIVQMDFYKHFAFLNEKKKYLGRALNFKASKWCNPLICSS